MKISLTKLKISFFSLILTFGAWAARPVAQVVELKGQVFTINAEGKTKSLKMNDHIEEKSEVLVGEEGSVTINDYYDSTYHLIEGSHIKFFNKSAQLKQGKTWIQSLNSRHPLTLTTANGQIDFWKGEFITTFEQSSSKTQVLVVNGEVEVSNVLEQNMKHTLTGGTFTTIDPDVENGLPRAPTKVGLNSLNTAMAEFKALPQKLQETSLSTEPSRTLASVGQNMSSGKDVAVVKKGEILFMVNGKMSSERSPASVSAHQYFKKKITWKNVKLQSAPIKFYGITEPQMTPVKVETPRQPASEVVQKVTISPKVEVNLEKDTDFNDSLRKQQDLQSKYSKEYERLIQDLSSY